MVVWVFNTNVLMSAKNVWKIFKGSPLLMLMRWSAKNQSAWVLALFMPGFWQWNMHLGLIRCAAAWTLSITVLFEFLVANIEPTIHIFGDAGDVAVL
jgi:hypothetical protein